MDKIACLTRNRSRSSASMVSAWSVSGVGFSTIDTPRQKIGMLFIDLGCCKNSSAVGITSSFGRGGRRNNLLLSLKLASRFQDTLVGISCLLVKNLSVGIQWAGL